MAQTTSGKVVVWVVAVAATGEAARGLRSGKGPAVAAAGEETGLAGAAGAAATPVSCFMGGLGMLRCGDGVGTAGATATRADLIVTKS
jgi:hypothetical protein